MKTLIMFILFFAFVVVSANAEMFKWVDENGVVHFSDTTVPSDAKAESIYGADNRNEQAHSRGPLSPQMKQEVRERQPRRNLRITETITTVGNGQIHEFKVQKTR